jgi:diaminopropionate ammonia-lyase
VSQGLDAAIAIPDAAALDAMHNLRALGVDAGPCGAASLAGLRAALAGDGAGDRRTILGITERSTIVLVSTDGRASGAG